jgi:hypothetical protein
MSLEVGKVEKGLPAVFAKVPVTETINRMPKSPN